MSGKPSVGRKAPLAALVAGVCALTISIVVRDAGAHPVTGFVAIDAGWSRACALTTAGSAQCWGATYGTTPQYAVANVSSITVGGAHACALAETGVRCWGANAEGQLGNGQFSAEAGPVDVVGLTKGVSAVAAGGYFTCALVNGGVKCWGDNSQGQLGNGTSGSYLNEPADVSGMTEGAVALAAGDDHACAITTAGGVMCWGSDGAGQLGDGASGGNRATPAPVSGLSTGVTALALGADQSCAVVMGAAKCWGGNANGQLGDGTVAGRAMPVDVAGLASGVLAIAAGDGSTCALTTSGGVKCWGANDYGQLGDGTTSAHRTPADVSELGSGVTGVTAGSAFACALTGAGATRCWGLNDSGQLGDGTTTDRRTPVDVVSEAKPTPVASPAVALDGDANCDERVDSIDAALILQYSARLIKSVGCAGGADVNDDGAIDSRDAALVLQTVAGLIVR